MFDDGVTRRLGVPRIRVTVLRDVTVLGLSAAPVTTVQADRSAPSLISGSRSLRLGSPSCPQRRGACRRTWQPTGEKFADWWDRQDTTARNVWLRSMNIRVDFKRSTGANGRVEVDRVNLDLGDVFELTERSRHRLARAPDLDAGQRRSRRRDRRWRCPTHHEGGRAALIKRRWIRDPARDRT